MATTKDYELGEFTYPRGWFMVADAAKLTNKPLDLHFFGRDFALYRGSGGRVVLLDAYCPHMGTHLARNTTSYVVQDGSIEGDSIRCPYHGWRFGPDGKCNQIPYSDQPIPRSASIRSWPVEERMGAIFVWHDPEGGAPEWQAPRLEEWDDPSWVRWQLDDLGQLRCHPQEIVDNIADAAHLGPIHGATPQYFENEFRGHLAIQRQGGTTRGDALADKDGSNPLLRTDTAYHGPGVLLSRMTGLFEAIIFIVHTPVDDGLVQVWHGLLVKSPGGNRVATEADVQAARAYQQGHLGAFAQDFEVWANKRPCIKGMFLPSDGPFLKARTWYRQFYNPRTRRDEFLKQVEGIHSPRGLPGVPAVVPGP
ncbi:(2Fe-2S)-binding protein [Solimonas sp. K1W22B-7]|uniref:Rieske 2Fe-2S domain-containing protein n=1 Tax=Solimonas sp. K1W22B-7 TaxID=2303331 RepID=UPI000E32D88C|nr:Rieske 2Fe-2S domain-containing protein [Solimonas sp. K1W22B-7]AXQ28191.1 (2Fe-2S)-binding protein [Solimonas sp. K1W22B-7]